MGEDLDIKAMICKDMDDEVKKGDLECNAKKEKRSKREVFILVKDVRWSLFKPYQSLAR